MLCLLAACGGKSPVTPDAGTPPPAPPCSACTASEICVRDRCVPRQCATARCGTHQACFSGRCRDLACDGINCPASTACAAGTCYPLMCGDQEPCAAGEGCVDGACTALACVGVSCPADTTCVGGLCLARQCGEETCPVEEYCLDGDCTEKACVALVCPSGTACFGGTCEACGPGTFPPGNGDACLPVQPPGTPCSAGYQCTSGTCVEGACCTSGCVEPCTRCDGGTCAPLPAGAEDARCGPYRCLAEGTCGQSCSADDACDATSRCVAGACIPRAVNGAPCSGDLDCASGTCVDGTCCATSCSGPCATCNAPGMQGTCAPRPTGTSCRSAASACDAEESCDGTSLECPSDGALSDGASCRPDTLGDWSPCALPSTCSGAGTRSRTVTSFACEAGSCTGTDRDESESCTTNTEGAPCGTATYGPWSACSFSSPCDETGTRSRTVTRYSCSSGACTTPQTSTETSPCTRDTDGDACGSSQAGAWSACNYAGDCSEFAADSTRQVTAYACKTGTCSAVSRTERRSCTRNTDGAACAPFSYGAWGTCTYASTCDETGSQKRSVTEKRCNAGSCVSSTSTDSRGCTRDTDGRSCGRSGCTDACKAGVCDYKCSTAPGCNYC